MSEKNQNQNNNNKNNKSKANSQASNNKVHNKEFINDDCFLEDSLAIYDNLIKEKKEANEALKFFNKEVEEDFHSLAWATFLKVRDLPAREIEEFFSSFEQLTKLSQIKKGGV
jgi:hypothetical protein